MEEIAAAETVAEGHGSFSVQTKHRGPSGSEPDTSIVARGKSLVWAIIASERFMASKTLMSVEEYLRTSFDDADCEYLDGEIVERNMGERGHAAVQGQLLFLLMSI